MARRGRFEALTWWGMGFACVLPGCVSSRKVVCGRTRQLDLINYQRERARVVRLLAVCVLLLDFGMGWRDARGVDCMRCG